VVKNRIVIRKILCFFLIWLAVVIFFSWIPTKREKGIEIIGEKSTLYYQVQIFEKENGNGLIRCMRFEGRSKASQSCIDLNEPLDHVAEYTEMAFAGLLFLPRPESMLVIGHGGGIIPTSFSKLFPNAKVDIVEIDPDVPPLSSKYFGFSEKENMNVHIMDGRRFIRKSKTKYDIVVLDAYRGEQVPFHLKTEEFYREIKEYALSKKGVLVSNVIANTRLVQRDIKTCKEVFKGVFPFLGKRSGNLIIVATDKKERITLADLVSQGRHLKEKTAQIYIDFVRLANLFSPETGKEMKGRALTDDFAPVNHLLRR